MGVTLELLSYNPFVKFDKEFSQIWPHRGNIPRRHFEEYLTCPENELKYLILCDDGSDTPRVVGCTGLWKPNEEICSLEWHGLIPSERGKGYSAKAFELVCEQARIHYPGVKTIVEYLPEDRETILRPYFESLGFQKTDQFEQWEDTYSDLHWLVYTKNLY